MRAISLLMLAFACQLLSAQEKLLPVFHFDRLTTAEGLPSNETRSKVVRDRDGFVWVGTGYGLARYDGYGCKVYLRHPGDPSSLSGTYVGSLHYDSRGRLWVGNLESGLSLYDREHDHFVNFLPRHSDPDWLQYPDVNAILEDRSGSLWLGTAKGVVRVTVDPGFEEASADSLASHIRFRTFSQDTILNDVWDLDCLADGTVIVASTRGAFGITTEGKWIAFHDLLRQRASLLDTALVRALEPDKAGRLWLGTKFHGLFRFDPARRTLTKYRTLPAGRSGSGGNQIWDLKFDQSGRLWIATEHGLELFDPVEETYVDFLNASETVRKGWMGMLLSCDATGTVWITTAEQGLFFLHPVSFTLPNFGLRGTDGTPRQISRINAGDDGTHWVESEGRLLALDLSTRSVQRTVDLLGGRRSQYGPSSWESYDDKKGHLWYGTWGLGLYKFEPATGRVENFRYSKQLRSARFNSDICRSIAPWQGDTLVIATHDEGLLKFDTRTNRFLPFSSGWRSHVTQAADGSVWVTDEIGSVFVLNPSTGENRVFAHQPSDSTSLSVGRTWITYQDPAKRTWVGCGAILDLWEPATGTFRHFRNEELPTAVITKPRGSDARGYIWVEYAGNGCLGILNPSTGVFSNFDQSRGLCGNARDMALLRDGSVALVGILGMNIVYPESLSVARSSPPLVLSRMSVNDVIRLQPRGLPTSSPMQLTHSQNVVEFEFAAIDPGSQHLIEYRYRLEGLEDQWINPTGRRFVRYPGLSPGDYVFRVRATSKRNEWQPREIALAISILPPWWRTIWAYMAYAILAVGLLLVAYRLRLRQIRLKQRADMEHFQVEHLAEVDRLKSRFFSNISHEFRTPLTLILGPAEQGLEVTDADQARRKFRIVRDNARKLLSLVNQLLDFSHIESGMMKLQVSEGDIVAFLRRAVMSFESWAERKAVRLSFVSDLDVAVCLFDADKLEKVLTNLLSNALKFTPEGGSVRVSARVDNPVTRSARGHASAIPGDVLTLAVSDTGTGIAPEHLPHIFDRFYRADEAHATEGTGIGLALVKELVQLHRGTISAESTVQKGSTFTLELPVGAAAFRPEEIVEPAPHPESEERLPSIGSPDEAPPSVHELPADGKPTVLIVEDNGDLRAYIREYLDSGFAVIEAENGKVGYESATDRVPDLIISDVMMPEMDGMELCRALKQDIRTSHIPVILLTARAGTDSKVEGLETGADDYITKPFDQRELMARVRNLIEQRQRLREKFSAGMVLKPGEVTVTTLDDVLLKKVMETVEARMGSESFGVEDLAREVGLSPRHLHRKLQGLTNLPPGDFIRYMRLQRAYALLQQNAASAAEIAYQVGFGSPAHFAAAFRKRFGCRPSDVRNKEV